tara:strand:+ start:41 stop:523 length:483 start_codon:yes stop_codon:yes gene_type:complete
VFQNGTKKKIRLFFLFIARWCQFNRIGIGNSTWSENSISFEREDGLASYLLFRRWLGLRATYASNASTAREFFVSLSAMRGESARSDVSREKNSNPTAGNRPLFCSFQTGGSEERGVEEARRETRAFLFGDVRRTFFLLWRHLFFRGYRWFALFLSLAGW